MTADPHVKRAIRATEFPARLRRNQNVTRRSGGRRANGIGPRITRMARIFEGVCRKTLHKKSLRAAKKSTGCGTEMSRDDVFASHKLCGSLCTSVAPTVVTRIADIGTRVEQRYIRMTMRIALPLTLALIAAIGLTFAQVSSAAAAPGLPRIVTLPCPYSISNMALYTHGNKLLNSRNKLVVLHGVDLPSLEWNSRGDHIRRSMRVAITQWHCQIIRIPTSVNRWFGQTPGQSNGGRVYRHIVDQLIRIAARHKVYVVLDLHWNDMDRNFTDMGQHRMPDHSCVLYWRSAARRYMDYPNVFYDLYNEPHGISWITWRDGGICTGETKTTVVTYRAVGMQRLYDVVRNTGARNIVIIGGTSWAYDDFGVTHGYAIAGKNIVYDCHVYPWKLHWKHNFELAANSVPLIFDEFGGTGKQLAFGRKVIAFAAAHHISWCSWSFHTRAWPVLIKNWNYRPSTFGVLIKKALISTKGH